MSRFAAQLEWIDQQQGRMSALLERWGNINSGTHNLAGLQKMREEVRMVAEEFSGSGAVREIDLPPQTVTNERGEREARELGKALSFSAPGGRNGARVFLAIHMDTVFGKTDSFQKVTRLQDDVLRGPGVCDAKGGLVVMLFALMALERSDAAGGLHWEVLINPDEEIGSQGSGPLFTQAAGGGGGARRNDLGLVFEPALPDGALVSARKGSGNFVFVVHGVSAHAGRDSAKGRNAIHALAEVVTKLAALAREIPGIVVNTGAISGGGALNIVPDLAIARLNVRAENAGQQRALEDLLGALVSQANRAEGIRVEVHGGFHCPPKVVTPASERLLEEFRACGEQLGLAVSWRATGGACDGNRLAAAGLPTIDSLGVRGGNMHTSEEFVHLDSLAERAKLTALFLMRLAAGEIQIERRSQEMHAAQEVLP